MAEEEFQSPSASPAPRKFPYLVILPLLVLAGVGLRYWLSAASEPTVASGASRVQSTLHLEPFVLNLADTEQRSYLRVGVDLGLKQDLKSIEKTVSTAQVRDSILTVLGEAKVDELMTAAGKAKLKQEILRTLGERVPQLGAEEVYFTEFLIQR